MGDFVPKVSIYNLGLSAYDWKILLGQYFSIDFWWTGAGNGKLVFPKQ